MKHRSRHGSPAAENTPRALSSLQQMRKLGPYRPSIHIGFTPGNRQLTQFSTSLPIRRPWPAIVVTGFILVAFASPLFFFPSFGSGTENDSMFTLMFSLFSIFWKIGWSVGVAILALVFTGLLFAREKLVVRRREVVIRMEWLGLGFGATYPDDYLSNLRTAGQTDNDGLSWRGRHLVFDYFDVPVHFGSHLDGEKQIYLMQKIQQTLAGGIPVVPENLPAIPQAGDAESEAEVFAVNGTAPVEEVAGPSSGLVLVLANLIPIAGVLFLGWQIGELMLLFWIESAIIGIFNVFRMAVIGKAAAIFMVPFFIAHYGGFMAGHLLFLFSFFINADGDTTTAEATALFIGLWPAIAGLFVSHGYSFVQNFLGRQEYKGLTLQKQMHAPYKRIIIMHVTIILGGFLVMAFGNQLMALLLLLGLKIAVDLAAHRAQHKPAGKDSADTDTVKAAVSE